MCGIGVILWTLFCCVAIIALNSYVCRFWTIWSWSMVGEESGAEHHTYPVIIVGMTNWSLAPCCQVTSVFMSIGNNKDMVNCLTSWWKDFTVFYHVMQNLHVILTMKSDVFEWSMDPFFQVQYVLLGMRYLLQLLFWTHTVWVKQSYIKLGMTSKLRIRWKVEQHDKFRPCSFV